MKKSCLVKLLSLFLTAIRGGINREAISNIVTARNL